MTRTRIGLALSAAVLGLSGLVGFTAGGSWAATPVAQPTPEPTAPPATSEPGMPGGHHGMDGILHGEGTITTKQGTQLVAIQHGTVTSVSDSKLTVKSSDGYTRTWSLSPSVHILEHRTTLQPSSVKVGTDLALAGSRNGTQLTANLIIVSPGHGGGTAPPS